MKIRVLSGTSQDILLDPMCTCWTNCTIVLHQIARCPMVEQFWDVYVPHSPTPTYKTEDSLFTMSEVKKMVEYATRMDEYFDQTDEELGVQNSERLPY